MLDLDDVLQIDPDKREERLQVKVIILLLHFYKLSTWSESNKQLFVYQLIRNYINFIQSMFLYNTCICYSLFVYT